MNYEQKYKEALERAKYYHSKDYMLINSAIEDIFPELKESEDERIRKELIAFIKKRDRSGCDYDYDKWIAWLEKQGEKLDADKVIEWLRKNICTACYNEPDVTLSQRIEKFKKDFGL